MTDRFWVGGTGSWTDAATANWSATSGGAGGASAPTTSDDVVFDGNSGAGVVTVSGGATVCKNAIFTGFSGTLAGSGAWTIAGGLLLVAGMTFTNTSTITFTSTGAVTIACGGKRLKGVVFNGVGGSWTCQDDFKWGVSFGTFNLKNGTFDANDFNVDGTGAIDCIGVGTATLNMGNGTWTVATNVSVPLSFSTVTIVPENSTFIFTAAASGSTFGISGSPLNNVQLILSGAGQFVSTSNVTFNGNLRIGWPTGGGYVNLNSAWGFFVNGDFTLDPGSEIRFGTVNSTFNGAVNVSGTSVAQNKIRGLVSKSSGTVNAQYATITNSAASGGATWKAPRSQGNVDGGGNTGWLFDSNVQQIIELVNAA